MLKDANHFRQHHIERATLMPNMSDMQNAVYVAIRRDYRSRVLDLSRALERQGELTAQLVSVNAEIINTRRAIAQLDTFAAEKGWARKELADGVGRDGV